MYNVLNEITQVKRLLQIGVRDFCEEEWRYISENNSRIITYFDQKIKERLLEGQTWKEITEEIINDLPDKVYLSFDIDGLHPALCPSSGTPVPGGFQTEEVLYCINKIIDSGRTLIGFDLVEIGVGESSLDANVGARLLWRLCNLLVKSNCR
jgi:agmatinase